MTDQIRDIRETRAAMYSDDEAATSRDRHERLTTALLAREADLAEAITREHIATALQDKLT